MNICGRYFEWYQLVAAAFIVLYGIPYLIQFTSDLTGSSDEGFSDQEKATREALEPSLDSLLLDDSDISHLPGDFYDCTSDVDSGLDLEFAEGEGGVPGDLEDAEIVDHRYSRIANVAYCDSNNVIWLSSILYLPSTKEDIVDKLRNYSGLAKGNIDDLDKVVDAYAGGYYSDLPWSEPAWIAQPELGNGGYGFKFSVRYPNYHEPMIVHDFTFIRDVVHGSFTVRLPQGDASDEKAIALAQSLDQKIQARLESLTAEVQGR